MTPAGEIVWRYVCPVVQTGPLKQGEIPGLDDRGHQYNAVFKVRRYPTDYPGLLGKDLTPQGAIEVSTDQTLRVVTVTANSSGVRLSWASLPAQSYVVQYKATLSAPAWTDIGITRSLGTLTTFTDTDSARLSQPQGFYRVILAP